MTDFKKIANSIVVHFAHICAYGAETVKRMSKKMYLHSTFTTSHIYLDSSLCDNYNGLSKNINSSGNFFYHAL